MSSINVYLPAELKAKMAAAPDANWSSICQQAIKEELSPAAQIRRHYAEHRNRIREFQHSVKRQGGDKEKGDLEFIDDSCEEILQMLTEAEASALEELEQ